MRKTLVGALTLAAATSVASLSVAVSGGAAHAAKGRCIASDKANFSLGSSPSSCSASPGSISVGVGSNGSADSLAGPHNTAVAVGDGADATSIFTNNHSAAVGAGSGAQAVGNKNNAVGIGNGSNASAGSGGPTDSNNTAVAIGNCGANAFGTRQVAHCP